MQLVCALILAASAAASGVMPPESARCLGCHERISLIKADTLGGGHAVSLETRTYAQGSHAELACIVCHPGYDRVPHSALLREPAPTCRACHVADPTGCSDTPLERYENALSADVHRGILGPGFTCTSCHDPHTSRLGSCTRGHESNPVCMTCHGYSRVLLTHYWLPSAGLHLRQTGCTACHCPPGPRGDTHGVLTAGEALRDCAECHDRSRAVARFGPRAESWGTRGVPGWRSRSTRELVTAGGLVVVASAAILWGILHPSLPMAVVLSGPGVALRAGAIAVLLISGAAIFGGNGRWLEGLSHVHVLSGVLMIAAFVERVLLYARKGHIPGSGPGCIRAALLLVLAGSGLLLIVPTLTPMLDAAIPAVREVHRLGAAALTLWVAWALIRR